MPNMDGTGPQGKGPKTGRGLGKCNDTSDKGYTDPRGRGRGRGMGRNFNQGFQNSRND